MNEIIIAPVLIVLAALAFGSCFFVMFIALMARARERAAEAAEKSIPERYEPFAE